MLLVLSTYVLSLVNSRHISILGSLLSSILGCSGVHIGLEVFTIFCSDWLKGFTRHGGTDCSKKSSWNYSRND